MILVAVGTQFGFDRLVRAVDDWAFEAGRDDVVAQVGPSSYQPRVLRTIGMVEPGQFAELQRKAEVIVAHAGMGSILGALEAGKPIIIMPRRYALGEHRNDHQLATAARFSGTTGIHVAAGEAELRVLLNKSAALEGPAYADRGASEQLLNCLRAVVAQGPSDRLSWLFGRNRVGPTK